MQVLVLVHYKHGQLALFKSTGSKKAQQMRIWAYLQECFKTHPAMSNANFEKFEQILEEIGLDVHAVDVLG